MVEIWKASGIRKVTKPKNSEREFFDSLSVYFFSAAVAGHVISAIIAAPLIMLAYNWVGVVTAVLVGGAVIWFLRHLQTRQYTKFELLMSNAVPTPI